MGDPGRGRGVRSPGSSPRKGPVRRRCRRPRTREPSATWNRRLGRVAWRAVGEGSRPRREGHGQGARGSRDPRARETWKEGVEREDPEWSP